MDNNNEMRSPQQQEEEEEEEEQQCVAPTTDDNDDAVDEEEEDQEEQDDAVEDSSTQPGLTDEQVSRQAELMRELSRYGLHLRLDSTLCRRYIVDGPRARVNDVRCVVQKMCTAHYLHMYCNHQLGHAIAVNTKKARMDLEGRKYSAEGFLSLLQRCILLTTRYNKLPMVWPWMSGITPRDWAIYHDISDLLIANPNMPREELLRL